jgi:sigma-B regulation protein RsbU (phosphoserine phosphatase)
VAHQLVPGDVVAFYTDGITDRQAAGGAMFDLDRLRDALTRTTARMPADIVTAVVDELDAFAGGEEPDDDQTLLVIGLE